MCEPNNVNAFFKSLFLKYFFGTGTHWYENTSLLNYFKLDSWMMLLLKFNVTWPCSSYGYSEHVCFYDLWNRKGERSNLINVDDNEPAVNDRFFFSVPHEWPVVKRSFLLYFYDCRLR